ncbi:hypothetical protein CDAR_175651 [Caerostris darwini]|uniref:Uncharacterized protein n=1 Tax=Caerostris darwini TaxID=1538125 RepID=A0AAV4X4I8_9ARAC|nr:hypothetical protein CDAR_175651 [Caerostris darwini]
MNMQLLQCFPNEDVPTFYQSNYNQTLPGMEFEGFNTLQGFNTLYSLHAQRKVFPGCGFIMHMKFRLGFACQCSIPSFPKSENQFADYLETRPFILANRIHVSEEKK